MPWRLLKQRVQITEPALITLPTASQHRLDLRKYDMRSLHRRLVVLQKWRASRLCSSQGMEDRLRPRRLVNAGVPTCRQLPPIIGRISLKAKDKRIRHIQSSACATNRCAASRNLSSGKAPLDSLAQCHGSPFEKHKSPGT